MKTTCVKINYFNDSLEPKWLCNNFLWVLKMKAVFHHFFLQKCGCQNWGTLFPNISHHSAGNVVRSSGVPAPSPCRIPWPRSRRWYKAHNISRQCSLVTFQHFGWILLCMARSSDARHYYSWCDEHSGKLSYLSMHQLPIMYSCLSSLNIFN